MNKNLFDKIFLDPKFFFDYLFFQQSFLFQQIFFWQNMVPVQKFLGHKFFRTIFFSDPKSFSSPICFSDPKLFSDLKISWLKRTFNENVYLVYLRRLQLYSWVQKTELLNLRLSKLARAKVLVRLEFDTKNQVLFWNVPL